MSHATTEIWLIRHAQAAVGPSRMDADHHLTRLGKAQAHRLGRELARQQIKPARIWHSTMTRARETAQILARYTRGPLKSHPKLYEFGTRVLTLNCSLEEAVRRHPKLIRPDGSLTWVESRNGGLSWSFTIADESLRQLHRRALAAWNQIAASAPPGKTIFVVAHGSYLSALLTEALGLPLAKVWRFEFPNTGYVRLKLHAHGRRRIPVLHFS